MATYHSLHVGVHYKATDLDQFVNKKEVVLLSSNENHLFSDPEREFKVIQSFNGFFEHSSDNGEKEYRSKKAYVLEKV